MPELSRRDFLKLTTNTLLTASGLLGFGALFRFLGYQTEPLPQTEFDLGPASNYPIDSRTLLSKIPALLLHTDEGFSALSLVCTHLGCTVEPKESGFTCPCHGSKYDAEGSVLNGPAQKKLNALRVEVTTDGNLILHTD
ncbi:MAG: ubiquinol-cytochrome c reductase iron-sulfur subunit [Anaerolineales bacterium]|nr:ubiquinol-cytochrome c reductase iron-sulfur subunit [Anaerolineales bacterium]